MMTDLFQPGQHPDADQLNAFVEHALPPQERNQTLAHLAVCPDCRAVVALSLPPLAELPKPQPVPERTPWFTGWRLAWPAAALAASVLLTIYLQRNIHRSITSSPPVQTATTSPPPQLAPQGSATPGPSPTPRAPAPRSPGPRPTTAAATAALIQNLPVEARSTTSPMAGQPSSAVLSAQPQSTRSAGLAMGSGSGVGLSSDAATMAAPAHAAAMAPSASNQFTLQLRSGAPATAASAMAPGAANSTVTVNGTSAAPMLDVESANASATIDSISAVDSASLATVQHPLPGHHPILSIASASTRIVAIDTRHNLFFSDDAGRHWKKIRPEWSGNATRVALAASSPPIAAPVNGLMDGLERRNAPMSGAELAGSTMANNLVTGAVMDPTGAIISGATVSVKDPNTGTLRSVTTGRDGRFLIAGLPPGADEVQASAPGFQRLTTTVQVPLTGKVQTNLTLSIGSASATVTVESNAASLAVVAKRKTAASQPNLFEITTDTGERWTSVNGHTWQRQ